MSLELTDEQKKAWRSDKFLSDTHSLHMTSAIEQLLARAMKAEAELNCHKLVKARCQCGESLEYWLAAARRVLEGR